MNDFGWPQWTVIITLVIMFVWFSVNELRDWRKSAGQVTAIILGYLGYIAFFAYVLHAGGFW
ncbi:MAG TPA: hypothetical protein VGM94_01180 [Galbitalea sp.]|jgi:hypothetical protein